MQITLGTGTYEHSHLLEHYTICVIKKSNIFAIYYIHVYDGFLCASGLYCEEDINECENSTCYNGGNCTNHHGSFMCSCNDGFFGTWCENAITDAETTVTSKVPDAGEESDESTDGK